MIGSQASLAGTLERYLVIEQRYGLSLTLSLHSYTIHIDDMTLCHGMHLAQSSHVSFLRSLSQIP